MTDFAFVLSLDSDIAVVRNLDHILDQSVARGTREVRTPKGCQGTHYVGRSTWIHGTHRNVKILGFNLCVCTGAPT